MHLRLGRLALHYIRGDVVRFGPWADSGFANHGFYVFRWWSFGRLFVEWRA